METDHRPGFITAHIGHIEKCLEDIVPRDLGVHAKACHQHQFNLGEARLEALKINAFAQALADRGRARARCLQVDALVGPEGRVLYREQRIDARVRDGVQFHLGLRIDGRDSHTRAAQ